MATILHYSVLKPTPNATTNTQHTNNNNRTQSDEVNGAAEEASLCARFLELESILYTAYWDVKNLLEYYSVGQKIETACFFIVSIHLLRHATHLKASKLTTNVAVKMTL